MSQILNEYTIIRVNENQAQYDKLSREIMGVKSCHLIIEPNLTVYLDLMGECLTQILDVELLANASLYCLTDYVLPTVTVTSRQASQFCWCLATGNNHHDSQLIKVELAGPQSRANIYIFPMVQSGKRLNLYTQQIHRAHCTQSTCNIVGSLQDDTVFKHHGKIVVNEQLDLVTVDQHTQMVLLGKPKSACVIPELDIRCSSVNCAHGAAIGSLEKDSVWYLGSRGVGVSEANNILLKGLCLKAVKTIEDDEFRKAVEKQIALSLQKILINNN